VVFETDQGGNLHNTVTLDLPVKPGCVLRPFSYFPVGLAVPQPPGTMPFDSSARNIRLSGVGFATAEDVELIIPVSAIEKCASYRHDGPFSVPWDVWASENTRALPHCRYHEHGTFRSRIVCIEAGAGSCIKVLDFTPNLSVWPGPSDRRPSDVWRVRDTKFVDRSESAIAICPETFARTNLRYHESRRILETRLRQLGSVHVDDENILIVCGSEVDAELIILSF